MHLTADQIKNKKERYNDQVRFHLDQFHRQQNNRLKLFFVDVQEHLTSAQENLFLLDGEVYPEDYATFRLVIHALKAVAATDVLPEADFVVFPFNLYFYRHCKEEVDEAILETRRAAGNKPFLFFFISDFCLRPVIRSVPTERKLLADIQSDEAYFPGFISSKDYIIHFESTLDLLRDIAIFPLIPGALYAPDAAPRQYLFSFAGEYCKPGWPEGLVRSPSRKQTWESLIERNQGRVFIGSAISDSSLFKTIPQHSVFTLCPRGIASWSFRLFEAVANGSIPVILSDSYIKPFSDCIPWDRFSITIPESRLDEVDGLLEAIRPEIVEYMQDNLKASQAHFTLNGLCALLEERLLHLAHGIRPCAG